MVSGDKSPAAQAERGGSALSGVAFTRSIAPLAPQAAVDRALRSRPATRSQTKIRFHQRARPQGGDATPRAGGPSRSRRRCLQLQPLAPPRESSGLPRGTVRARCAHRSCTAGPRARRMPRCSAFLRTAGRPTGRAPSSLVITGNGRPATRRWNWSGPRAVLKRQVPQWAAAAGIPQLRPSDSRMPISAMAARGALLRGACAGARGRLRVSRQTKREFLPPTPSRPRSAAGSADGPAIRGAIFTAAAASEGVHHDERTGQQGRRRPLVHGALGQSLESPRWSTSSPRPEHPPAIFTALRRGRGRADVKGVHERFPRGVPRSSSFTARRISHRRGRLTSVRSLGGPGGTHTGPAFSDFLAGLASGPFRPENAVHGYDGASGRGTAGSQRKSAWDDGVTALQQLGP